MMALSIQASILGALVTVAGGACVLAPRATRGALRAFPRHRLSGWVLTTVVLAWSGWLLYHGPLGFLEPYRSWLFALVPLAIVLTGLFVDELLAPRALGGLLLLVPAPLLDAARWHPSAWRYVIIAVAYAMVIKGAALVVSPYLFRRLSERLASDDAACRRWGMAGVLGGAGLLALGLLVY